jgi:hypothetical protein
VEGTASRVGKRMEAMIEIELGARRRKCKLGEYAYVEQHEPQEKQGRHPPCLAGVVDASIHALDRAHVHVYGGLSLAPPCIARLES